MAGERFALRHGQVMRLMVRPFGDQSGEAEAANAREGLGVIRLLRDDNQPDAAAIGSVLADQAGMRSSSAA